MTTYVDTSFLGALYLVEAHSKQAWSKIRVLSGPLLLTEFVRFEFANAMGLRVFRKEMLAGERLSVMNAFAADLQRGVFRVATVPSEAFRRAEQVAEIHTAILGNRALDVLHIASALTLKVDSFLTLDQRQAKLATAAGLRTI